MRRVQRDLLFWCSHIPAGALFLAVGGVIGAAIVFVAALALGGR